MEPSISQLNQILHQLIGYHRQLLEAVRAEKDALVQLDLKAIQDVISIKQSLIESIHQSETERLKLTSVLATFWKVAASELTLTKIIIQIQSEDPHAAKQMQTNYNALTVLIQRISAQNGENRALISRSMEHVQEMKKNILGEANPKSDIYTPKGQHGYSNQNSRLISREV